MYESIFFKVFPSIVQADTENEICIICNDGPMRLYDDTTYEVQFVPSEESDVPRDEKMTLRGYEQFRKTFLIRPQNGKLKIKYYFAGEQQWNVRIKTKEYKAHENQYIEKVKPAWDCIKQIPENGVIVSVYSLYPDLYKRRVLRGDLHVHTDKSDGRESPAYVAARYRKYGYDFIAFTDHYFYDSGSFARTKFDFETDFQVLVGEEIHNGYNGSLHIVNIGSSKSINDMFFYELERIEKEVAELGENVTIPNEIDKKEYLYRMWIYRETKKYGGLVIFPHPYWKINGSFYHCGEKMSMAILKNGLCDAFEVIGGVSEDENNLQIALYNEVRGMGVNIPVVGSTDNHTTEEGFDKASTYVFSEGNNIVKAVGEGYCVAMEHIKDRCTMIYGSYRLVKYARFLVENYLPIHNELCNASGTVLADYINGNKELKQWVELLEKQVLRHEKEFFNIK